MAVNTAAPNWLQPGRLGPGGLLAVDCGRQANAAMPEETSNASIFRTHDQPRLSLPAFLDCPQAGAIGSLVVAACSAGKGLSCKSPGGRDEHRDVGERAAAASGTVSSSWLPLPGLARSGPPPWLPRSGAISLTAESSSLLPPLRWPPWHAAPWRRRQLGRGWSAREATPWLPPVGRCLWGPWPRLAQLWWQRIVQAERCLPTAQR